MTTLKIDAQQQLHLIPLEDKQTENQRVARPRLLVLKKRFVGAKDYTDHSAGY